VDNLDDRMNLFSGTEDGYGGEPVDAQKETPTTETASLKRSELIRLEANLDAQPIWAPSSHADDLERIYPLKWRGENASVTVQSSGTYGMLRSFDKLVLTALVHFWNRQGQPEDGRVYFQIADLLSALDKNTDGKSYELVKQSLHRLRGCLVQYQYAFFDNSSEEWLSLRDKTILSDLMIVEPKKKPAQGNAPGPALTFAVLDFMVVANLLGNFTRPVSLKLLQSLSEKGILFESYANAVLYRNAVVRKDVFELWKDLGLSTKGINYGSQLASRMRKDLDKICEHGGSLLASYSFEKSKTRARSQNLILTRVEAAQIAIPSPKYQTPSTPREQYETGRKADRDKLVEWVRFELHDDSDNDANIRAIVAKLPEAVIRQGVHDAFAYYRDGHTNNPVAYFAGIMKRVAKERGINLGLRRSS
jgi:hypothetical protein